MAMLFQAVLALFLLSLALYVQWQVPRYTRNRTHIFITRAMLILVGIGFGMTGIAYVAPDFSRWMTFLTGFGMVHVPAAIIMFIKSKRGEQKA